MNKLKQKIKDKLGEKKVSTLRKILKVGGIVKNIICWTLIAVLTLAIVTFMVTKLSGNTPSVFGYSLHRVVSGSMEPELSIGDVIVNKKIADPSQIRIGDIVTFRGDSRFENEKVTHRVLVAPYENGRGDTVFVTKGDANEIDDGEISVSAVESKFLAKVTFLKSIYDFFFSPWGLVIFIFLLLLIFFDEIMNIVRLTISRAEEEQPETLVETIERMQREQSEKTEQLPQTVEKGEAEPSVEKSQKRSKKTIRKSPEKIDKSSKKSKKSEKKAVSNQAKKKSKKKSKKRKKR